MPLLGILGVPRVAGKEYATPGNPGSGAKGLASFEATTTVTEVCPVLVPASPQ